MLTYGSKKASSTLQLNLLQWNSAQTLGRTMKIEVPQRLSIDQVDVLRYCRTYMKTATVRDLRNNYLQLMEWLAAGEQILITRRGRPIARLTPESTPESTFTDWSQSATVARDRSQEVCLSAEESGQLLKDSGGPW